MRLPALRRTIRVKQHDSSDCGAACLKSIAAYYGLKAPIARIRELASTDARGSTILGLVSAAERLGFAARGVKGTAESLSAIPLPAIAHVRLPSGYMHYVVITGRRRDRLRIMDPIDGRISSIRVKHFLPTWTGILVLLAPAPTFTPGRIGGSATRRLLALLAPHRRLLGQSFAGALVQTVLGLSMAVYVQKLIDHAIPAGNVGLLNLLGVAMLGIIVAQVVIEATRARLTLLTGQRLDAVLLTSFHSHLLRLPRRFYDTRRVGEVTARFGDAVKIRSFINDVALDLVVSLLVVVFTAAFMLAYSPRLAALVLSSIPLFACIYVAFDHANATKQRALMERAADLEAEMVQGLTAAPGLVLAGARRWAGARLEMRVVRLLRTVYGVGIAAIGATTAATLVTRLVTLVLLWTGATMVVHGRLSTGEMMSFYALTGYLTGPVVALIGANRTIREAMVAADRLFEILDLQPEEEEGMPSLPASASSEIRLENVTMRYGAGPPTLHEVSVRFPEGSLTVIVGSSGSGKSTVAGVIQGAYTLASGRVVIGGFDLRHISRESLRARLGVVPQKPDILPATLAENIALGDFDPDFERIAELVTALGLGELVGRSAAGYLTMLGDGGIPVSGGERQRLAVARALYRRPRVLLLDEPTAALDVFSETSTMRLIDGFRQAGGTVILISHRLHHASAADQVIVLEGGRVVQAGHHDELIASGGPYSDLWRSSAWGNGSVRQRSVDERLLPRISATDPAWVAEVRG